MSWIAGSLSDLRMALRLTRRQIGTSLLVVATLALGIGISAAAFAALDRVVLNPLPYEHGDRMRYLSLMHPTLGWRLTPDAESVSRWRQGARLVERIETYRESGAVYLGGGPAESVDVLLISTELPGMLGVRPIDGRMLGEADAAPDAPAVVMVHESFWRSALGGDPGIVGRDLRLTTGPVTVVGIWPARARLNVWEQPELVRAMRPDQEFTSGGWTHVLGLLPPRVDDAAAAAELQSLVVESDRSEGTRVGVLPPAGVINDAYVEGVWLVFAAAVALLVVAVLNAANLLLGRATTRSGELGVRLALGGSPARILRLFFTESALLAGAGAAAGFGIAWIVSAIYAAWSPPGFGAVDGEWLHERTTAFAALSAVAAAIAGACLPAWRVRQANVREILGDGARATDGGSRLRGTLVGAQAALAVVLVAGAAITGRSFIQLASVDPGFDVDPLAMVSVGAARSRYPTEEAQAAFIQRVREAIEGLPQVDALTVTSAPPFQTSVGSGVPVFEGEPEPAEAATVQVRTQGIDDQFFAVFGTPLRAGRLFEPGDAATPAVIVNESFARAHGGNAVGRRLAFGGRKPRWYTVVGVVGDVVAGSLEKVGAPEPQLYFPSERRPDSFARFVLRVDGDPAAVISAVRARVAEIDPLSALSEASTVRELFDRQTARHRFVAYLLGGLALFGLVFAVSGVYGVVALEAARRRREVGLRVALGASAASIAGYLVRHGLRPVLVGAALGVTAALLSASYLEALLFRVSERDPLSAAAGVGLVVATATIGCLLPARRAAHVDPAVALRKSFEHGGTEDTGDTGSDRG